LRRDRRLITLQQELGRLRAAFLVLHGKADIYTARGSLHWGWQGLWSFDVQSTIGGTFPTGNPAIKASGRLIAWNVAARYKLRKLFWPEIESNATFFKGGPNEGKTQEFITPGLTPPARSRALA
jgi:hypothetical protein